MVTEILEIIYLLFLNKIKKPRNILFMIVVVLIMVPLQKISAKDIIKPHP